MIKRVDFDELDAWVYMFVPQEEIEQMLTEEELHNRYHYHAPTEAAKTLHDYFNKLLEKVASEVEHRLPEGRQKALVHTNLEQAKMWINAAIAQNHDKL